MSCVGEHRLKKEEHEQHRHTTCDEWSSCLFSPAQQKTWVFWKTQKASPTHEDSPKLAKLLNGDYVLEVAGCSSALLSRITSLSVKAFLNAAKYSAANS
jgi:hypothetical protein